ncbi:NADH:ubiquinone oxidoreductase [Coemansia sp. RSA 1694]|nr:NADH:ubiquinone oxidoreductase [Coemansia sp. RSA 1694]
MQVMESRLNRAMEHNSSLIGEVQTKKILVDEVQRLKDELKDLNLELNVVRGRNSRVVPQSGGILRTTVNSDLAGENSARVVNDIMARVKDLESRLAGARTKVTPLLNASNQYATVHSRAMRSRPIASPKAPMSHSNSGSGPTSGIGGGSESMQNPTHSSRTLSSGRAEDLKVSAGSLLHARMEKSRLAREAMRKQLGESDKQQTVPQRRPAQ